MRNYSNLKKIQLEQHDGQHLETSNTELTFL
jgi:hypothetical protein